MDELRLTRRELVTREDRNIGIVGLSGCGKTRLAQEIVGLFDIDAVLVLSDCINETHWKSVLGPFVYGYHQVAAVTERTRTAARHQRILLVLDGWTSQSDVAELVALVTYSITICQPAEVYPAWVQRWWISGSLDPSLFPLTNLGSRNERQITDIQLAEAFKAMPRFVFVDAELKYYNYPKADMVLTAPPRMRNFLARLNDMNPPALVRCTH